MVVNVIEPEVSRKAFDALPFISGVDSAPAHISRFIGPDGIEVAAENWGVHKYADAPGGIM